MEAQEAAEGLREQLRAALTRAEGAGLSSEGLKQQLAEMQKEVDARERKLQDASADIDALQAEIEALQGAAAAGTQGHSALQGRAEALQKALDAAKVRPALCFMCHFSSAAQACLLACASACPPEASALAPSNQRVRPAPRPATPAGGRR